MKLLVPISYFQGLPRSEIWILDTVTGQKNRVFYQETVSERAVDGKGITGLAWLKEGVLVACDFNQVWLINSSDYSVTALLQDNEFNDLHQVSVVSNQILVSNTGRDSVDVLNGNLSFNTRHGMLSDSDLNDRILGNYKIRGKYYDRPQQNTEFFRRKVPDNYHINHSIMVDGRLLITCFKQKVLIDALTGEVVSNEFDTQPHDGFIHADSIWVTTVAGKVYRSTLAFPLRFVEVIDMADRGPFKGWCRGLAILNNKIFIGITAVKEITERTAWLKVPSATTKTGIYQLNLNSMDVEFFFDFTNRDGSRIFTFIQAEPYVA
ncbi:hypothetical protein WG68_04500 [Arsukibacterium ikkense]|uniref:SMP-30/Gluconolactonase/LRE-like region domain-containing protein n=1 Tax=Arsukibacterium ikkense TaxID=336831 RepID=A0A0M2VBR5_9GAMM|nr:hypothetical protein [Arsukibacterium ikkense]KKO46568.1 hypothetical protein WG68_04500 [Arsukibacterium ikkense]